MRIRTVMSNCSGIAIQEAFERIVKNNIPNKEWLNSSNYYKINAASKMNGETTTTLRKPNAQEYMAGSVILHCSDGWQYITRSIDSLLNGDISSAIHLAYYAELRSAMSLMAFDGVGVFDRNHIYFNAQKKRLRIRGIDAQSSC